MKNIKKVKEEIKKQLINVKLMCRDDRRNLYNQPKDVDEDSFMMPYDPSKDDSYFKIIEFNDDYKISDGYYIICEVKKWETPEIMEMKIEFDNDGYFHIYADYTLADYYGKIDM